jgi:sphingomyelin phosphodiesterase
MAPIFTFGLGSFSSLGKMLLLGALVGSVVCAVHAAAPPPNPTTLGPSVFTAGPLSDFTTLFREWYNNPTATSAQPQPKVTDPVSVRLIRYLMSHRRTDGLASVIRERFIHFP